MLNLCRREASFRSVDFTEVLAMGRMLYIELLHTAVDFVREIKKVDVQRDAKWLAFRKAHAARLAAEELALGGDDLHALDVAKVQALVADNLERRDPGPAA
jgi:type 1 glutamine amidotransferase